MNFDFDLNSIIPYKITKYNSDFQIIHPKNLSDEDTASQLNRDMIQKLCYIIDKMGEASSKAQGLKETITSSKKLAYNDRHRIYIMKEAHLNGGKGAVVGFLKVGEKKLFVYDQQSRNHEMSPLCVLDFYVCENQQRRGYGRSLFDCMLEMERVEAQHLAIDSPSEKSIKFLKKHYNLINPIPQRNSYVVYNGIFDRRQNNKINRRNNTNIAREEFITRKGDMPYSASAETMKSDLPLINTNSLKSFGRTISFDGNNSNNIAATSYYNNNMRNNTSLYPSSSPNQQSSTNSHYQNANLTNNTSSTTINSSNSTSNTNNINNAHLPYTAQPLLHSDLNKQFDSILHDQYQQQISQSKKKIDYTNFNAQPVENYNQAFINNFYNKHFNQNSQYQPFPSLVTNYEKSTSNINLSRPPLPPSAAAWLKKETTNATVTFNDNMTTTKFRETLFKSPSSLNNGVPNIMTAAINKNTPELLSNPSYVNSKFRKTKLW